MYPSLNFSAPEILRESVSKCTFSSDIFSLGLVMSTLFKIKHEQQSKSPYFLDCNESLFIYKDKVLLNLFVMITNYLFKDTRTATKRSKRKVYG